MCIILTTFVYLQCKLALQVQSKHIKILKTKTKTKTKLKPTSIPEEKKKKTLGTIEINVKTLWTLHFFYLIYKKLRSQQL